MTINNCRSVPLVGEYDVVVCGGGPSGWVSAVAAAREGRKTALIERFGFFGGAATANLVVPISGFFKNERRVVGGIPWEFIQRLVDADAAKIEFPKGHISVNTEYYKLYAQRMVLEAGVEVYSNSYISGAVTESEKIRAVIIENKNGTEAVGGQYFIDATGDGDLCAAANVPMEINTPSQPLSFCFALENVSLDTPLLKDCIHHNGKNGSASCNLVIRDYLQSQYAEGKAPLFGGPWFNTQVKGNTITVNMTRHTKSVLNNREYAAAEFEMREDIFRLVDILREKYPEFENCVITNTAVNAGVRESRHLTGKHKLTEDELLHPEHISDAVALAAHPIDIHCTNGPEQILKQTSEAGRIPYGAMVTYKMKNLIAAGRIISADKNAYASIRVQGTCMAIGAAAGIAAVLCCEMGAEANTLDYQVLKERLLCGGNIIMSEK